MYVIVVGAGRVGYYLAKALLDEEHEVLILERSGPIAAVAAEELGSICVRGDGCEATTLASVGTNRADMLIAVTGEGEVETDLNYYGKYEIKKIVELIELEFIKPYNVQEIDLHINNKPVILNEFVQRIMKNIINAMINSLKGIEKKIKEIDLRYKKAE